MFILCIITIVCVAILGLTNLNQLALGLIMCCASQNLKYQKNLKRRTIFINYSSYYWSGTTLMITSILCTLDFTMLILFKLQLITSVSFAVQISYYSTSPLLDDSSYSLLFRMRPSDSSIPLALASIFKQYGWSQVAVATQVSSQYNKVSI